MVAKGIHSLHAHDVDYGETFSPIVDIRSMRIFLAIATFYDYEIWQMDVKNSFLNGHLSEDVYMVQPESKYLGVGIKGLIKKIGFTQNPDEPCVYLKASRSNVAFLILYVDDILLIGNNVTMLQSAYLEKTLKKFRMENSKKGYTPMMEKPYHRNPRYTRPDVAFAQNLCSRFQQNLGEIHWTAVKTILKYLRNTKDTVLVYGTKPEAELKVTCYADASFQTDKDDTKSQTGYMVVLNAGAIEWKSAKQSTTAMSFTKSEYIAAAEASMEAVWMRKFIDGLSDVMPSNKRPMEMLCDNEPAIAITNDTGILKGARHFQKKYHYNREVIQEREIVLKKVHTDDNVANTFRKPMSFNKHYEHAMAIGIVLASSLM
ncbi:retrotransposon protein, putative, ty1-copia subclass [Tanacetum coccineum]